MTLTRKPKPYDGILNKDTYIIRLVIESAVETETPKGKRFVVDGCKRSMTTLFMPKPGRWDISDDRKVEELKYRVKESVEYMLSDGYEEEEL